MRIISVFKAIGQDRDYLEGRIVSVDRKDAQGLNFEYSYLEANKKRRNQQKRLRRTDVEGKPEEYGSWKSGVQSVS